MSHAMTAKTAQLNHSIFWKSLSSTSRVASDITFTGLTSGWYAWKTVLLRKLCMRLVVLTAVLTLDQPALRWHRVSDRASGRVSDRASGRVSDRVRLHRVSGTEQA